MATADDIWQKGRHGLVAAAVGVICYLGLKPSPARTDIPLMPLWLGRFLDRHDFFCNVAGFVALTLIVHASYQGWRRANTAWLGWRAALIGALVIGLELAQRFIPRRTCDIHDIEAGLLGVALATLPWMRFGRPGRARRGAGLAAGAAE